MSKKTKIKTAIRKIVREEVAMAIQEVITELKQPKQQVSQPIPKKKIVERKQYSNNSILNDVLNETVGLTKSVKQTDDYPTLGGGAFDTSRMVELMGYGKSEDVKRDMVAVDSFKKAGVKSSQVPEALTNALTRDYSDLMKALDKKGK